MLFQPTHNDLDEQCWQVLSKDILPCFNSSRHRIKMLIFDFSQGIEVLPRGGGALGYFFGWVCAARDSKLAPVLKKISPKIDTVLEMGQFFIPRSRIRPKTDTPF